MRLKSVYISEYKNLRDFTLHFDGDSFMDVFVGKNGTGKSNLFEALIEIFRHIVEFDPNEDGCNFSYRIAYEIGDMTNTIEWSWGEIDDPALRPKQTTRTMKLNGNRRRSFEGVNLPDNVLVYYSGHNQTVGNLLETYKEAFAGRIKEANLAESRFFLGIGPEYKELLLASILIQPEDCRARRFVREKLGIDEVAHEMKVVLQRPLFARNKSGSAKKQYNIEDREKDRYWKAQGITINFLDRLKNCFSKPPLGRERDEGYFPNEDHYIHYYDFEKIRTEFEDLSAQDLFRQFDNLQTLEMLGDISIELTVGGEDADLHRFSDGQFQSVYIFAIAELFKERNCILLLDEPDSFLHPEWQYEFLKQVFEITEDASETCHVLLSSHSASTLCPVDGSQISLFQVDGSTVKCVKRAKHHIIQELSNSFIQYSEDESKLLINNVIRTSSRPILFVEGVTDVKILNIAYQALYPNRDIPVLVQDAFDRGFMKVLISRDQIYTDHPKKLFYALFDIDDAYEDWRKLNGETIVGDIESGMCKKLHNKNAYAFLLPLQNNAIKSQVWNDSDPIEKIVPKPVYGIEHVFWGTDGVDNDTWFRKDASSNVVRFKGDSHKVRFANNVIPTLDAACFEPFRPMFDFIFSKCPSLSDQQE